MGLLFLLRALYFVSQSIKFPMDMKKYMQSTTVLIGRFFHQEELSESKLSRTSKFVVLKVHDDPQFLTSVVSLFFRHIWWMRDGTFAVV